MTANSVTIPISFKLRPSLTHRVTTVGSGLLCIAGSVALIGLADTSTERLVGYVGSGFFGLGLIGYLALLWCGGPRIDIDQEGIYVKTSLADGLRLAWGEIAGIERTSVMGQDMIVVTPLPGIAWQSRLTLFARWMVRLNQSMGIDGILLARVNLGNQYDLALFALQNSFAHACRDKSVTA